MELFKLSYGKMGREEANLTATIRLLCVESYIRGCNYNVTHKHDILCVLYHISSLSHCRDEINVHYGTGFRDEYA
jgi:hypothetical protein